MTPRAASARAASETRRVSSRVPDPDARASPLANAPKHRYTIGFVASTREPSRGSRLRVVPTPSRPSTETSFVRDPRARRRAPSLHDRS